MLDTEGGLSKECHSLTSQWRKLRPGEGKRHLQGHGIHLWPGRVYCLALITHFLGLVIGIPGLPAGQEGTV